MNVLYIGGTGEISHACVQRSVGAGQTISVFNRGRGGEPLPGGVRELRGDLNDPSAREEIAAERFDVICQFIAYETDTVLRDIEAFAGHCGHYVFISSASCYQKPLQAAIITEDVPVENPYWEYSQKKIACEELLAIEADRRNLPWTIVRPSHTYRKRFPGGVASGEHTAWRLRSGKPIVVHGDGLSLWTYTHAEDFAAPFVGLLGKDGAHGQAFHITRHLEAYTWDAIFTAIAAALDCEPELVHVPTDTLVRYNADWAPGLRGDKAWSAVFDNSKVMSVAGPFTAKVSLEEGTRGAAKHYFADPARSRDFTPDPGEDALIDRIVAEQKALGGNDDR